MDSDRWQRVEQLCHAALEREESGQAAYLEAACGGDADLRREVESLLAHQRQAGRFMETPAFQMAAQSLAADTEFGEHSDPFLGRRLGPYQIVERIGSGGMGEVYRAVRADEEYRQQVAIKMVRGGLNPGSVNIRFRNERQILASLDHPNIARLLDGGTTEEGVPYVVMELIEGQRIDQYCDSRKLSIPDRLKLFTQVCSAVQYAHQRLIVHRDIKPGNILVTSNGVPKLLDFGIAKILDAGTLAGPVETTLTVQRVLTPGYASPEQVKGGPITTASDVYSLGVVLYELLTRCSPYHNAGKTANELALAVCQTEPEKPSTAVRRLGKGSKHDDAEQIPPDTASGLRGGSPEELSKRLSGDLDNIVLMALRKEPERRYASVEQFSEDLRRHLENLPVIARKDTIGYRASKFVMRHKAGVAAAAATVVTLIAGMAVTLHEARVARQQAEVARAQSQRAERRFNDVRKLSNSLFDIHDAIANLPGTLAARKMIVGMSLNYLDSLAGEASGDASLQRELSDAYVSIGDIQGRSGTENLGDISGTMASYRKAAQITQALLDASPESEIDRKDLGVLYMKMGHTLLYTADHAGALDCDNKALSLYTALIRDYPENLHYQNLVSIVHLNLGQLQDFTGDYQASLASYSKAAATYEKLAASTDKRRAQVAQYNIALTYLSMEITWQDLGNYRKALEYGEKSLQIRKLVLARNVSNVRAQLDLADSYTMLAETLRKKGDLAAALAPYRRAQAIAESVEATDPNDQRAKEDLADALYGLGETFRRQGNVAQAFHFGNRAAKISSELEAADPSNAQSKLQLAKAYGLLGDAYQARRLTASPEQQDRSKQALSSYQKALDTYSALQQSGGLPYSERAEMDRLPREIARCHAALQSYGLVNHQP
ncbi:MAG TPA: serine/threonine-protein kinase, partial [Candidatus Angelobacter sp.]